MTSRFSTGDTRDVGRNTSGNIEELAVIQPARVYRKVKGCADDEQVTEDGSDLSSFISEKRGEVSRGSARGAYSKTLKLSHLQL